jgi:hypothetical protein
MCPTMLEPLGHGELAVDWESLLCLHSPGRDGIQNRLFGDTLPKVERTGRSSTPSSFHRRQSESTSSPNSSMGLNIACLI